MVRTSLISGLQDAIASLGSSNKRESSQPARSRQIRVQSQRDSGAYSLIASSYSVESEDIDGAVATRPTTIDSLSLDAYLASWLRELWARNYSPHTLTSYQISVVQFRDFRRKRD